MMATLAPTDPARPRLSPLRQAMLSFFWLGTNAHWAAILITTLPNQALRIGGDEVKGRTLSTVLAAGALVSMLVAPLFGALSDRIVTRWGRRVPWVVLGTLMNIIGLFGLAHFPRDNDMSSLPLYIGAFMWVEFWNNVATAPFSALIPDMVPKEQRGSASGWLGLMNMLGNFAGGIAGLIFTVNGVTDITGIYYFLAGMMFVSMLVTVIFVKEPKVTKVPPPLTAGALLRGLYDPLKNHDFRWVFFTRLLMTMGTFTVEEFLQYFFRDVIKDFTLFGVKVADNAESATSFFIVALLIGALASSLGAGLLSDRVGRKRIVYASSILQAIVPIVLIFRANMNIAVILGVVFGLGFGAYTAVDWALASDTLPSDENYARDMGVWHVAFTLPQVIGNPIAGNVLDGFQRIGATSGAPNLGYTAIFILAVFYFVLGTVLVKKIRSVR
ncbi:MAG: MFS transporter [Anaerolineae bacterium]|nr:MFS transporter [Anaerolineae bacterium]